MKTPERSPWRTIATTPYAIRELGPVECWRKRTCKDCGKTKYVWAQVCLRFAKLVATKPKPVWQHWSRPVREVPEQYLRALTPVVECRCLGATEPTAVRETVISIRVDRRPRKFVKVGDLVVGDVVQVSKQDYQVATVGPSVTLLTAHGGLAP
jgi:hypothetical protein